MNMGLHNPSNNLATNLIREKNQHPTQKQRTLHFTNTGKATAGEPRLKERERAPPLSWLLLPFRGPWPARAGVYSPVQMTLFQLR